MPRLNQIMQLAKEHSVQNIRELCSHITEGDSLETISKAFVCYASKAIFPTQAMLDELSRLELLNAKIRETHHGTIHTC